MPKPVQHPLHPAAAPPHAAPGLLAGHGLFSLPGSSAATALLLQRTNEEEKWLARQRRLRQEKEDRQSQVSEFRQQVLEQQLDLGRPPAPADPEHRPESARWAPGGVRGSLRLASASGLLPVECCPLGSVSPSKTPVWAGRRETGEEEGARFRGFIRQEMCPQPARPTLQGRLGA